MSGSLNGSGPCRIGPGATSRGPLGDAVAADALSREFQALLLAAIRNRHPDASERECFLRLAVIKLGRKRAMQLYPDAASLFGP